MKHLKSVTVLSDKRSHWGGESWVQVLNGIDIIEDRENEFISWASVEGADVDNSGFVRFKPAPGDRGTEVKVVIEYAPPGSGSICTAKLFGEEQNSKSVTIYAASRC